MSTKTQRYATAECRDCGWAIRHGTYLSVEQVQGRARRHSDAAGSPVVVTITKNMTYNADGAR